MSSYRYYLKNLPVDPKLPVRVRPDGWYCQQNRGEETVDKGSIWNQNGGKTEQPSPRNEFIDDEASCSSSDSEMEEESAESSSGEEIQRRLKDLARRKLMFRASKRKMSEDRLAHTKKRHSKKPKKQQFRRITQVWESD